MGTKQNRRICTAKMTAEKEFFLKVLSDHLSGNETVPPADINWDILYDLSHMHQMDGIVYYQCKNFIPAQSCIKYKKLYLATVYSSMNIESSYKTVDDYFKKANIQHFIIKGLKTASCYPVPALRTMGDLDIVVPKEEKERAGEILMDLGFVRCSGQYPDYNWEYVYKNMHYELHHQLIYDEIITNKKQELFFNDCWRYIKDGDLDWSFHFLFLFSHLRKHMMNYGAGFRMFMDIAAMIQRAPDMNWPWIEEKLEMLEMGKFSKICFVLIETWFGIKAPISCSPELN